MFYFELHKEPIKQKRIANVVLSLVPKSSGKVFPRGAVVLVIIDSKNHKRY